MSESAPQQPQPESGRIVRPQAVTNQSGWVRWLPGLQVLRRYEMGWLRHDVMAGLALTAVLVPVGIAYAVASGVPAICGLYANDCCHYPLPLYRRVVVLTDAFPCPVAPLSDERRL